jgi:hypothetical protein
MKLVKIKSWKQMEEEFGMNALGSIACNKDFTTIMNIDLPENRIIKISEDYIWEVGRRDWDISDDMIEEELDPKKYPQYFI